jgi:hypothetical protein
MKRCGIGMVEIEVEGYDARLRCGMFVYCIRVWFSCEDIVTR